MHVLVYYALQLYIRQFGDLGKSVIANRYSTVANGDFGDRVGNPCFREPAGFDTVPHATASQAHGCAEYACAIANCKEKKLRSLVPILQLKVMNQSIYRITGAIAETTHFVS